MHSRVHTFTYPDGEIQRVQLVRWNHWSDLDFLHPTPADSSHLLDCFADIYRQYLVPTCPWIFGHIVLFTLPEDNPASLTKVSAKLQQGVKFRGDKPCFSDKETSDLWHSLDALGCIRVVSGKLPTTQIISVAHTTGYLSKTSPDAALKVNASFFIMDMFDCATIYDHIGTPLGLCVKNGVVENPPLYQREALLVRKDGSVTIEHRDIRDLDIEINGTVYRHGVNGTIYTRPDHAKTPIQPGSLKLIIVGNRVVGISTATRVPIPASGFVLCIDNSATSGISSVTSISSGDSVIYHGMEDVVFGIQVGNSILRDGKKTDCFHSHFFDIYDIPRHPWHALFHKDARTPFPPSLYPMDFKKARAARIALGADKDGHPMLLWAEGAGKLGYTSGQESCGASLSEMADICHALGMVQAVNLDGGGSAQILLDNCRSLRISDRNRADNSDAERAVPLGLIVSLES